MAAKKEAPEAQVVLDFISKFFSYENTIFCIQEKPLPANGWPPNNLNSFIQRFQVIKDLDASYYISTMIGADSHRNSQDNFGALVGIVLDDIGTKGVGLSDVPLPPTYVIESSKDNYQCGYIFDTPLEDIDLAKTIVQHIYGLGVADGGGALVNKFVRLPWGINNKQRDNEVDTYPCRIVDMSGPKYTVNEIVHAFAVVKTPRFTDATVIRDSVTEALIAEKLIISTKEDGVLIECPWGESHSVGKTDHAIYYPIGTGNTPSQRGFKCHHNSCKRKRGDDLADYLRNEGHTIPASSELEYMQQRYCLIEQSGLVGDFLATAADHHPTSRLGDFKNARTYLVNTGRMTAGQNPRAIWKKLGEEWQDSFGTTRVNSIVYDPSVSLGVVDVNGKEHFNLYSRPSHALKNSEPDEYIKHVEHILPQEEDRELFHDWVAYKLQNPGKRSFMYLMITDGIFGIGRSVTGQILTKVFQAGVFSLNFNVFTGKTHQWSDWKEHSQLIIIEEIKDDSNNYIDAVHAYEEIKLNVDMLSTEVEINAKYQTKRVAKAYYNVLGFSNHADAIRIPDDDRRIYVARNADILRTSEEYDVVHGMIYNKQSIADIYHWLMARNVSSFDPSRPPVTAAKKDMVSKTRTDNEHIITDTLARLEGDLVYRYQIRNIAIELLLEEGYDINSREWTYLNKDINKLWRKLAPLNPEDEKHGGRLKLPGMEQKEPVRIIRNVPRWQGKSRPRGDNKAFKNELLKNVPSHNEEKEPKTS